MFNVWGHRLTSMAEWGLGVARVGNHCSRGIQRKPVIRTSYMSRSYKNVLITDMFS